MSDIFDRAVNITNKAAREGCLLAVFYDAGKVRTSRSDSKWAIENLNKRPKALIGFYDGRCRPEWLEDDIIWMQRRQIPTLR